MKMATQKDSHMKKKGITALIVIIILAGLIFAAQYLVNSVNIVELLRRMHGG
jgi:hypothetical protein